MVGIVIAPPRPGDPPAPTKAAMDEVRANRPERKSLLFRITAADERVAAASAGSLPVLTAIAGYDMARPNPRIFPSRRGGSPRGTSASTCAGRCSTEAVFARRQRKPPRIGAPSRRACGISMPALEVEVAPADGRAPSLPPRRSKRPVSGVAPRHEARRVIAERFRAGVATNTDVLTAETALLQAELDSPAPAPMRELAGARLMRSLGR